MSGVLLGAALFASAVLVPTVIELLRRRAARRGRVRTFRRVGSFIQAVDRVVTTGAHAGLTRLRYAGKLPSGREARLSLEPTPLGPRLRASVDTTRAAPVLRVRGEGLVEKLTKRLGRREDLETGDAAFDARFWLEAPAPSRGRRALEARELRRAVTSAFARFGVDRLTLQPGELSVEVDLSRCPGNTWNALLAHLDRVAALVDTRHVKVRVLEAEHPVACGPDGGLRCAYCRDGLTGDEDDLVACERCRTALHGGCWDEHGGCPMLGCEGRQAERGRART